MTGGGQQQQEPERQAAARHSAKALFDRLEDGELAEGRVEIAHGGQRLDAVRQGDAHRPGLLGENGERLRRPETVGERARAAWRVGGRAATIWPSGSVSGKDAPARQEARQARSRGSWRRARRARRGARRR